MKTNRILMAILSLLAILAIFLIAGDHDTPASAAPSAQTSSPDIEIEPELRSQFFAPNRDGEMDVGYLIYFRQRPDLSPAYEMDWEKRGRFVVAALQQAAESAQREVRAYLDSRGVVYKSYWIDNVILVDGGTSSATFQGLLNYDQISALRARRQPMLYEPERGAVAGDAALASVGSNIAHVNADDVWAMGYTGEGIVVANIDTGVRYTHAALMDQYRGYMGIGFNHDYNWWDPALGGQNLTPDDWHNHGSHTMGTILGDDGNGNQIGMAPGAKWIACQAFEDATTDDELLECGQFMIAPWDLSKGNENPDLRPHVVNNSWGDCLRSVDTWYKGVVSNWLAAGIYPIFSNGNSSNCNYSSPPGLNTVGNPGRYGNVTGVGSTGTNNGAYATHSNWGPTDDLDTINPAGYPSLKPQVVAPGVSIRSAYKSSDLAYGTMSGTSMSAPHVAGLVALMWQAAPCLVGDYANTETIIQESATPIPYETENGDEGPGNVPNHATGWGEIDALQAVRNALEYCAVDVTPETQDVCSPGEAFYDVRVGLGFSEPVTLTVDGLPGGATSIFSINPVTPVGTSEMTVSLSSAVAMGLYDFSVVGTAPSKVFSDTVALDASTSIPVDPTLVSPADGSGDMPIWPELSWNAVGQAETYFLEVALDAGFTSLVYSATVDTTSHTLSDPLAYDTPHYWRVRAKNICGDGAFSGHFEFTTKSSPYILLVDDDSNDPDVRSYYTAALSTVGFDYEVWDTQNSDNEPDLTSLSNYAIVIWFTGEEWNSKTGPGLAGETALGNWLDTGKCLLISSQDYHYARDLTGFMDSYLGLASVSDDVWQTSVTGSGAAFGELGTYSLSYPYSNWSDRMTPDSGVEVAFVGNAGNAAVYKDSGVYKTSFWAFPFEAIPTAQARKDAMMAFLEWCGFRVFYFPLVFR